DNGCPKPRCRDDKWDVAAGHAFVDSPCVLIPFDLLSKDVFELEALDGAVRTRKIKGALKPVVGFRPQVFQALFDVKHVGTEQDLSVVSAFGDGGGNKV